ncbi:MAG TPA: BTAD domain-containing putative transcriptional regulator [Mycobacteriales bacterium]|nr:BTAD domain-containing putative transcriptional regulator [Mycobacteriales bacterium]
MSAPESIEIRVLGNFAVRAGGEEIATLPVGSQRLLAYLALRDRAVARTVIAAAMWPDVAESRAGDSLRSALSRLDPVTHRAVVASTSGLRLGDAVEVDFRAAQALARRLLQTGTPIPASDLSQGAVAVLSNELLPDWHDEWVAGQAEDWRQLRVSALEEQARLLTERGKLARAAEAARAAIRVEPHRESAHAVLIRVHLAGGNQSEALRAYDRYRTLLEVDLGLEPTRLITDLVDGLGPA